MGYEHKQIGRYHRYWLIGAAAIAVFWFFEWPTLLTENDPKFIWIIIILFLSGPMTIYGLSTRSLLMRDEGDCLALRYGPIPLLRQRFSYSQMITAEPDRCRLSDVYGTFNFWGGRHTPGKSWSYGLMGLGKDCVKVQMGKKTVRIGTDDVDGLVTFLQNKIGRVHP